MPIGTILKAAFEKKKVENKRFSMQMIANKLEISLSLVSQILSGRRKPPADKLDELCKILDLDKERRDLVFRYLLSQKKIDLEPSIIEESLSKASQKSSTWIFQPTTKFQVLEDWFYLAILDTTLLQDYDGSTEYISSRLSLNKSTVENALRVLKECELIVEEGGRWIKKNNLNDFHSAANKRMLRMYHGKCLRKAENTLLHQTEDQDVHRRLITGMTIAMAENDVAWAQQKISTLMEEIAERSANKPADEVYQFSIQFFPLTRK